MDSDFNQASVNVSLMVNSTLNIFTYLHTIFFREKSVTFMNSFKMVFVFVEYVWNHLTAVA